MNTASDNKYYVYAYLDPRYPGDYVYSNIDQKFDYKPIYIGKGCDRRMYVHLNHKSCNLHLQRTIDILKSEGQEPIIMKIREQLSNEEALSYEIACIKEIGKSSENRGPLCNFTDGGDCGTLGLSREIRSAATKKMWQDPVTREHLLKNCVAGGKAVWRNPELAARLSKQIRERQNTPEMKELHSKVAKAQWENPEFRKRALVQLKWMNEIGKEARIESTKRLWATDSEFRVRQAAAVHAACSAERCHKSRSSHWIYNKESNLLAYAGTGQVSKLCRFLKMKPGRIFSKAEEFLKDGNLHFGERAESKFWTSFPGNVSPSILLKDYQKPSWIIAWFYPEGSTTIEKIDLSGQELSRVHSSEWKWGGTEFGDLIQCVI